MSSIVPAVLVCGAMCYFARAVFAEAKAIAEQSAAIREHTAALRERPARDDDNADWWKNN